MYDRDEIQRKNVYELVEEINGAMDAKVNDLEPVTPAQMGLDTRSSYGEIFYDADSECFVVAASSDRALQYYGGFEYVDEECRTVIGDWVIYYGDDSRVQNCIDRVEDSLRETE